MKNDILAKFGLQEKVAIITGTTRGLGRALAEALLEAGALVIALDRSANEHLPEFAASTGGGFERVKVDIQKAGKAELFAIIEAIEAKYQRIDILVNNAGITRRGEVEDFKEDDWLEVFNVNLHAPFFLSQAVSISFKKNNYGKIINIASMLSYQGGVRVPSYAVTKHGLVGLTKSFANGLGKYGINVNAIAPGFMATDLTKPLQDDVVRNASILNRIALGRWGDGDDLKGVLIFLASSMSDYVHGTVIPVDGGWLAS